MYTISSKAEEDNKYDLRLFELGHNGRSCEQEVVNPILHIFMNKDSIFVSTTIELLQYQLNSHSFTLKLANTVVHLTNEVIKTSLVLKSSQVWIGGSTKPKQLSLIESTNFFVCKTGEKKWEIQHNTTVLSKLSTIFTRSPKH